MSIDLNNLSLKELYELQKHIVLEIPRRAAAEKQRLLEELKQMAAERGFNLGELLGGENKTASKGKGGPRGPAVVKYRSKDGNEWTGRGRKPQWVNDHIAAGGKIEDLAV